MVDSLVFSNSFEWIKGGEENVRYTFPIFQPGSYIFQVNENLIHVFQGFTQFLIHVVRLIEELEREHGMSDVRR